MVYIVANLIAEYVEAGTFGSLIQASKGLSKSLHVLREQTARKKIRSILGDVYDRCVHSNVWKSILITVAGLDATDFDFLTCFKADPDKVICSVIIFLLDKYNGWDNEELFNVVIAPVMHSRYQFKCWGFIFRQFLERNISSTTVYHRIRAFYMGMLFCDKIVDYSMAHHGTIDMKSSILVRCKLMHSTRKKLRSTIGVIKKVPLMSHAFQREALLFKNLHNKLGRWIKTVSPPPPPGFKGKRGMRGPKGGYYYRQKGRKIYLGAQDV